MVRVTDESPCLVNMHGEQIPGLLHILLSNNQTAKVCFEDGTFKDIWWGRVRQLDAASIMDAYDYEDEEDYDG